MATKWYVNHAAELIGLVIGLAILGAGAIGTAASMQNNSAGVIYIGAIVGGLVLAATSAFSILRSSDAARRAQFQHDHVEAAYDQLRADYPMIDESLAVFRSAPNGSDELREAVLYLTSVDGRLPQPAEGQPRDRVTSRFRSEFEIAHIKRIATLGMQSDSASISIYLLGDSDAIRKYNFDVFGLSP